jgi:hypothetical protein
MPQPPLEHGKPGNSAWLVYYGFVLFAQLRPLHRADFLICLMRIREDLLKGAEQSCEGQADSIAPSVRGHSGTVGSCAAAADCQPRGHLAGVTVQLRNGKTDLDAKMLKAVEKALVEIGPSRIGVSA